MTVQVSSDHRTGLYVTIPLYFAGLLIGTAFWAYSWMKRMKQQGISDELSIHFLGGRSFGPALMGATVFASLFSGYTVVGIPNEAFRTGFQAFRWLPSSAYIVGGYIGTGIRLRKASIVRNHQTPVDFVTDRYRSQYLRYTIVFIQILASLIYLSAQVNALKSTFNSMFEYPHLNQADTAWPVIVMLGIIVVSECVGGLSSVILSDSMQGAIMLFSFVFLPLVILKNFGGWSDLDPDTYARPDFYQTPSKDEQWKFWQFSIVNLSFFTLPHLMMRIYAARDLKSLRAGWCTMAVGPWITMFVGVFLGTVGVQMLDDAGVTDPTNPFTAILDQVMRLGGFAEVVGVIALTAALAAIMSTADSLLVALSQLITTELVYPALPDSSPREVTWLGRFASIVTAFIALAVGFMWKEGITDLGKINFPVSVQAVPTFLFGLYANDKFDLHPWCLATGAILAILYVFVIYFGYIDKSDDPLPINAGITGVTIQVFIACSLELCRRQYDRLRKKEDKQIPDRPAWDVPPVARFGDAPLTPQLLNEMMEGVSEPFKNVLYSLLFFLMVTLVTPLVAEGEPVLDSDGEWVSEPAVINGLPWWFFKQIMICIVPYLMLFWNIFRTPKKFPVDTKKIETQGINPDVVELTPVEMGKRTKYDEPNKLARRRRARINKEMAEAGLVGKQVEEEEAPPDETEQLLVALVEGEMLDDEVSVSSEETASS